VAAADELAQGSLEAAERYLGLAERGSASVPEGRRGQAQVLLRVVRLQLARQRGNLPAVAEEARRLQALADAPDAAQPRKGAGEVGGEELRALALVSLGLTEFWAARLEAAQRHLEQGVALARRIGRPYLEFTGLAEADGGCVWRSGIVTVSRSDDVRPGRGGQALPGALQECPLRTQPKTGTFKLPPATTAYPF
jgi:hypothetical protein